MRAAIDLEVVQQPPEHRRADHLPLDAGKHEPSTTAAQPVRPLQDHKGGAGEGNPVFLAGLLSVTPQRSTSPTPDRPPATASGCPLPTWSGLWAMGRWQQSQIEENVELMLYLAEQIEERSRTLGELREEME